MNAPQRENNDDILNQKVTEHFPGEQAEAMTLLNRYESESAAGRLRVQLAVLKLSQGDLRKLQEFIEVARTDYRDVLFWAETPEQAKATGVSIAQRQQQEARDKFRRYVMLLLFAAFLVIILGVRLTTSTGEKLAMSGIFVLSGFIIIWRIQTGRL